MFLATSPGKIPATGQHEDQDDSEKNIKITSYQVPEKMHATKQCKTNNLP